MQPCPLLALHLVLDAEQSQVYFRPALTARPHGTLNWLIHLDQAQQMALNQCHAGILATNRRD